MTVYAITDTKKGRTGIAPTYLHGSYVYRLRLFKSGHIKLFHHSVHYTH